MCIQLKAVFSNCFLLPWCSRMIIGFLMPSKFSTFHFLHLQNLENFLVCRAWTGCPLRWHPTSLCPSIRPGPAPIFLGWVLSAYEVVTVLCLLHYLPGGSSFHPPLSPRKRVLWPLWKWRTLPACSSMWMHSCPCAWWTAHPSLWSQIWLWTLFCLLGYEKRDFLNVAWVKKKAGHRDVRHKDQEVQALN